MELQKIWQEDFAMIFYCFQICFLSSTYFFSWQTFWFCGKFLISFNSKAKQMEYYLLFIFNCINCTKTLCSRYKEHPDSLLCPCVNTLCTLKCSRSLSLSSSFSLEFLMLFSVTVCTVHPSCLFMKHYHTNHLILENICIIKMYSSFFSSTNNVLRGWKSPWFGWNLKH